MDNDGYLSLPELTETLRKYGFRGTQKDILVRKTFCCHVIVFNIIVKSEIATIVPEPNFMH